MNLLELWQSAWPAGVLMLVMGFGFALALLIASIKLKVRTDPKIDQVHQILPHLDCGACGFPGCSQYAKAVIENPDLIGRCSPGGPKVAEAIASVLNLQVSESGPAKRPIVHCRAATEDKHFYATYQGIQTCISANALANVQACKFGCLGFGDCVRACRFDALHIANGLAVVDYNKCTGCGACARACPRDLIEMIPFGSENMMAVACKSKEKGKVSRFVCAVGCIGCGICAKQSDLFEVEENLARLDYAKYQLSEKTEAAMTKCPTGVIVYRGPTAPPPRPPKQKTAPAAAK